MIQQNYNRKVFNTPRFLFSLYMRFSTFPPKLYHQLKRKLLFFLIIHTIHIQHSNTTEVCNVEN